MEVSDDLVLVVDAHVVVAVEEEGALVPAEIVRDGSFVDVRTVCSRQLSKLARLFD